MRLVWNSKYFSRGASMLDKQNMFFVPANLNCLFRFYILLALNDTSFSCNFVKRRAFTSAFAEGTMFLRFWTNPEIQDGGPT